MPAFLGPLVGWSLGVALAWISRAVAAREDEGALAARPRIVAIFAALAFAPICAYFLVFAADWSLAYLVDGRSVPSALTLLLVLFDAAVVALGFAAGARLARRRPDVALAALAVPAAIAAATVLALFPRLRVDGTFTQVRGHFGTQPVAGGPLGYAILWMDGLLVAAFVITARLLTERPRPPEPPSEAVKTTPETKQGYLGRRRQG